MTNINIKITKDMTEEERKIAKRDYMRVPELKVVEGD